MCFTSNSDPKMNHWRGIYMSYLTDSSEPVTTAGTTHWCCNTSKQGTVLYSSHNRRIRHGLQHLVSSYLEVAAFGMRSKRQYYGLLCNLAMSIDFHSVLLIKGADTEWGKINMPIDYVLSWNGLERPHNTHTHVHTYKCTHVYRGIYNEFSWLVAREIGLKSYHVLEKKKKKY